MLSMVNSRLKRLHLLKVLLVLLFCLIMDDSNKALSASMQITVTEPQTNEKSDEKNNVQQMQPIKPLSNLNSYESVEVMATGYTAGIESTGKSPSHPQYGITYSGVKVRKGIVSTIAADTSIFPLGTLLYIPGYGYGIVADTGSAIKGKKIDLFYLSKKEVYTNWGKKKVIVYIVKKGEGKVTETMLDRLNEMKAFAQQPTLIKAPNANGD
jgi:3D (Asp-Asp-Asp) domain-containing protein